MKQKRPLVAMSMKTYFGIDEAIRWLYAIANEPRISQQDEVEIALFPPFVDLPQTSRILAATKVRWGAQDVAPESTGNQTGEVTGAMLRELGCTFVEVGHAERRRFFGETDHIVHQKVDQAFAVGLSPLLCVGEPTKVDSHAAAKYCIRQLEEAVIVPPAESDFVVAYEPVWAIGADKPAPISHIRAVGFALKECIDHNNWHGRVIYGGTAGPGLARALGSAVDGLFLGRRAHHIPHFVETVGEVAETAVDT